MPSNIFLNERSLTVCFGGRCFCCEHRDCRLHAISSRGSLLVVEWQRWASRDRLRPARSLPQVAPAPASGGRAGLPSLPEAPPPAGSPAPLLPPPLPLRDPEAVPVPPATNPPTQAAPSLPGAYGRPGGNLGTALTPRLPGAR
ncbi:MAG: hypothetical protein IPK78_12915 [Rhodospirillales bacterium]|nr:hypothetical protein [Rhodospirillales bacterium]